MFSLWWRWGKRNKRTSHEEA